MKETVSWWETTQFSILYPVELGTKLAYCSLNGQKLLDCYRNERFLYKGNSSVQEWLTPSCQLQMIRNRLYHTS